MAKKIFNKRVLAMALTLVMLFNGFQISASAAQNDTPDLVQNFEDTYYKQDGTAGTANDWEIHLSKTAAPTEQDNIFDITLKIETKDTFTQIAGSTDGAAVLVLDVSSSMVKESGTCTKCGKYKDHSDHSGRRPSCTFEGVTHLVLLKEAVKSFLDSYVADAAPGDKRLVAVVKFATNADTVLSWIDVNDGNNLSTVKNAVDAMGSTSGTNIEAGLVLGRNLLNTSELNGIPLENQSLILFSDGSPTAAVGDVNNTSLTQVTSGGGYGFGGNGTSDDLDDILAGVSAKKKAVAYNTDADLLKEVFGADNVITSSAGSLVLDLAAQGGEIVTTKTNASTITDPMGTGVSMVTVTTSYNADTRNWDLSKFTPTVANGITTYTITYQVQIDPEAVAADASNPAYTVLTPANGATTLNYTYGEDATPVNADFNEPNIRGIRTFTVSYDYVGEVPAGAPEVPADATYKAGQSVQVAAAPTMANYTFSGWDKSDFVMPAEDVVIVGSWTENPKYDYSLTYDANFGDNETKADAENISGIYATAHNITVDANTFLRENYTFAGWNTQRDGSGKAYAAGNTVALTATDNTETLYAQWIENPKYAYNLTYDANFGANETKADTENVTGTYAASLNITVDANTFVRENYTFAGWNTERDGSGKAYTAGEVVALTAENNEEILYAQWVENDKYSYSVIYNANFGAGETKADTENVTGTYATEYEIGVDENTFVRPNHTFLGWATSPNGEVVYMPGDNIHFVEGGEEVLYAQWEEHPKYSFSVIYNGNGGALAGGELAYGDSENVADTYATALNIKVDANTFVRENYTFIGWNTKADGTGTAYAAEDIAALTVQDNTRTLYAQWAENPKYDYSVIYNANFDDNETRLDTENVTGIYVTALNIGVDENTFVRRGYTFVGWNTKADGTGTAYAAGDIIALTAENNRAVLYAQWQINEHDYTVNYWVRINGEAYTLFAGQLNGAPVGEKAAFGTVIDKAYLDAKGLPATLTDAELTYSFNAFEGITVAEEGNVVNAYFTCIVEEPPVEEPPVEEPPVEEPPVEEPPVEEPPVEEPPVVEPPVTEPPVTEPPVTEPPVTESPVTEPPVTEPPVTEPPVEEEVEIPEEDVPMADLPKTGDPIFVYIGSTATSAAGLICLMLRKKKEETEA